MAAICLAHPDDCLSAVRHTQFAEHIGDMILERLGARYQPLGNLPAVEVLCDQAEPTSHLLAIMARY